MHGTITIERDGETHAIALEPGGYWWIDPPLPADDAARVLPALARVVAGYRGPSDGAFGPKQVRDAAAFLRLHYRVTSVDVEPVPDGPPDRIY